MRRTVRSTAGRQISATYLTRQDLTRMGFSRHRLSRALADGGIIRVRRGRYAHGDLDPELIGVAKLGGRLDCVSLMRRLGVFVLDATSTHIQVDVGASRLPQQPSGVVRHWRRSAAPACALAADVVEALAQAVRCQGPREAIAMLDSALHTRLIDQAALALVFARLPRRFVTLAGLLDARSESGSESLMRLILRTLGAQVQLQVRVAGVGRVDFVVDGWLIIECDSEEHHSGWDAGRRDRRRDLAAARLGYTTVRVIAEDVFFHRDEVREALAEVLAHGPSVRQPRTKDAKARTNSSLSSSHRGSSAQPRRGT